MRSALFVALTAAIGCGRAAPGPDRTPPEAVEDEPAEVRELVLPGTCYAFESGAGDGGSCEVSGGFAPGRDAVVAIERCFRARLEQGDATGARITVVGGRDPELRGLAGERELRACLRRALAGVAVPGATACTLGLVDPERTLAPPGAARLEITPGQVLLDGDVIALSHVLRDQSLEASAGRELERVARLAARERAGGIRDLVVRAHPVSEGRVVRHVLGAFARALHPRLMLARAVGLSEVWAVVNRLGSSNGLECRPRGFGVELWVHGDGIELTAGGHGARLPAVGDEPPIARLRDALERRRRRAPGRVDVGLGIGDGARYRDVLLVLETALDVGMWDVHVLTGPPAGSGGALR